MSADLQARERSLRALLDKSAGVLSDSERDEVTLFLDAGEYGVAVETLCDLLREEGKRLPEDLASELRAIGIAMGLAAATFDDIGLIGQPGPS